LSKLDPPQRAVITLGSNIEAETNLARALVMLRQNYHLTILGVSRVYESAPIAATGLTAPDQPAFLNAALWVETDYHPPLPLKFNVLRFIEECLGRVRTADRFAPRPIDLDLALYADLVLDLPHLALPDPDILTRAHVALPVADVVPDQTHPLTGQTFAAIAATFADAPGIRVRDDLDLAAS
jgi:2-amino-4-hydroxy-6-hydroxymethyldihydropteridine diphosphokinase